MAIVHKPIRFYEGAECEANIGAQIIDEISKAYPSPLLFMPVDEVNELLDAIMAIYADASREGILEASQDAYQKVNELFVNGMLTFEKWQMLKDYVLELAAEYLEETDYSDGLT